MFAWSSLAMFLPYSIIWALGGTHAPFTAMLGPLLIVAAWLALSFVALRASVIAFDKAVPPGSDRITLTRATSNVALVVVAICGSSVLISTMGPHFSWATAVPSVAERTLGALIGAFLFGVARARQLAKHVDVALSPTEERVRTSFARIGRAWPWEGTDGSLTLTNERLAFRSFDERGHGDEEAQLSALRTVTLSTSAAGRGSVVIETPDRERRFLVGDADHWVDALRAAIGNEPRSRAS
jgi:hypothetical protein